MNIPAKLGKEEILEIVTSRLEKTVAYSSGVESLGELVYNTNALNMAMAAANGTFSTAVFSVWVDIAVDALKALENYEHFSVDDLQGDDVGNIHGLDDGYCG